jgi:hypothetical protein
VSSPGHKASDGRKERPTTSISSGPQVHSYQRTTSGSVAQALDCSDEGLTYTEPNKGRRMDFSRPSRCDSFTCSNADMDSGFDTSSLDYPCGIVNRNDRHSVGSHHSRRSVESQDSRCNVERPNSHCSVANPDFGYYVESQDSRYSPGSQDSRWSVGSQDSRWSAGSQDSRWSVGSQDSHWSAGSQESRWSVGSQDSGYGSASQPLTHASSNVSCGPSTRALQRHSLARKSK